MRKPHLISGIILLLMILAACNNAPETQVVLVVTSTFEPPTETALAAETLSGVAATEPPASATQDATIETTATETATPLEGTEPAGDSIPTVANTPLPSNFPTPLVTQIQVAEQSFEHGRMFWLQPNDEIWVMIDDPDSTDHGQWLVEPNTFFEGEEETDPSLTPPVDAIQPTRGFGKLWRDNDAIREALGWGVSPEFGFVTTYEYRSGGYLDSEGEYVPRPGIHILVSLGNEAFAFEEETSTWRLIE